MSSENTKFSFTEAQQSAIDARGVSVAVSAAAGSGKTRVLVQRVIELLTGDVPVSADRMLILTFANKAAEEMKTRISDALDNLIASDPSNELYKRQQLMLDCADICTVHSFCGKVVRDNFFRLGISRDFRIGSESELEELKMRIMSELVERYYTPPEEGSEDYEHLLYRYRAFCTLSLILSGPKLDGELETELLTAYSKYTSHAFPQEWMDKSVAAYDPEMTFDDYEGAVAIADLLRSALPSVAAALEKAQEFRSAVEEKGSDKKAPKAYVKLLDTWDQCDMLVDEMQDILSQEKCSVSELFRCVSEFPSKQLSRGNMNAEKHSELISAMGYINSAISVIAKDFAPYCTFTSEIFHENNVQLYPVLCTLRELLAEFDDLYFKAKCEREMLDFDDLQRLMLRLLYERDEHSGSYRKTEFACEMASGYDEIMVDEYQDTNDVQESIFRAVSRDEKNLFVVGDMKQSIYRFRDARPELFKSRCRRAADEGDPSSRLIVLDRNFRSRRGVIDAVNFLFSLLMSEDAGEIDYDSTQRLDFGASYTDRDEPDAELHLLEYHKAPDDSDDEEDDNIEKAEAVYCARIISDAVANGAAYRDICILLRSVKNKAESYAWELERLGIPVYTDAGCDLLSKYEVKAALAYLRVIANPMSDVDILASMMCPVFGFSPDDMAEIETGSSGSWYRRLCAAAKQSTPLGERCAAFIAGLEKYRALSGMLSTDALMLRIFEETGFSCVMRAMPGGALREENLRRLTDFAAGYESAAEGGLSGFVRHIKYLEQSGDGIMISDTAPPDAVRIMTIHHSKGLEFPICILAGTNTRTKVTNDRVRYHSEAGIGLTAVDSRLMIKYDTLQRANIKRICTAEEKSEQLRILYVALTRAKEKLIMLSTVKTEPQGETVPEDQTSPMLTKHLQRLAEKISLDPDTGRIDSAAVLSCVTFSDMILMCCLMNSSVPQLRSQAHLEEISAELPLLPCGKAWKYVHTAQSGRSRAVSTREKEKISADPSLDRLLRERFAKRQEDISTIVPSKVSASSLAHRGVSDKYVAVMKPDFAKSGGVSGTQRGKATHTFLQHASIFALAASADDPQSLEAEKQRLLSQRLMSSAQLEIINDSSVLSFARSELCRRMEKALRLYPEYRFTVSIPGELALAGSSQAAEKTSARSVLQGAIDCIVEEEDGLVIVDYKTDRVSDAKELAEIYGLQLRLYKAAAEQLFDKPVTECVIFSLHTGECVSV